MLHNYFDGPIKLLSDLAMFLDISTKISRSFCIRMNEDLE